MPLDPTHFLRCVSDRVTQVRDTGGNLLGCIPRVADHVTGLTTNAGPAEMRLAAQACLCLDLTKGQDPRSLPGFIPLDPTQMDLLVPLRGTDDDGDQNAAQ